MRRLQIQIRLNASAYSKYTTLAQAKNQTLSTYLRDKLESEIDLQASLNNVETKLSEIQHKLINEVGNRHEQTTEEADKPTQEKSAPDSVLTEIVLLLRGIARPEHMNMVHGELRRQGLDVFSILN